MLDGMLVVVVGGGGGEERRGRRSKGPASTQCGDLAAGLALAGRGGCGLWLPRDHFVSLRGQTTRRGRERASVSQLSLRPTNPNVPSGASLKLKSIIDT